MRGSINLLTFTIFSQINVTMFKGGISMYHILLAEDEKLVSDFITEYFNKWEIKAADGYEVCKQIRNLSNIPIIFINTLSLSNNQLLAYELRADDFITKPFKPSSLYNKYLTMIKHNYHDNIIKYGLIRLNENFYQVVIDGKEKSMLCQLIL